MSYRVAVWGPGNVGAPALRSVITHPELELAGVIVHSEAKEGRDAGELVGLPACGVRCTRDAASVLAGRPDALFYGANQDFRPQEAHEEMLAALRAGTNVVTAGLYGLLHPATADPGLRERFEAACKEGGSSFLVSGIDPGFLNDLLPLALSGVCEEIREIRMVENYNYAGYEVPDAVKAIIGFGSPMDQPPLMLLPGIPQSVWGGALRALGDALGLEVTELREVIERHPLERTFETETGTYQEGTQGAFRFEVQGLVAGEPVLVVEHITRIVNETAPQWPAVPGQGQHGVRITGNPSIDVRIECEDTGGDHVNGGNTAAAARCINLIPALCQAPAGLLTGAELPFVVGKGRFRL